MANKLEIKQIKYVDETGSANYPEGLNEKLLIQGNLLEELDIEYVAQIGIQTLPGVRFILNGGTDYITIGQTGIYEIELTDGPTITSLRFDSESIKLISEMADAYLIIDMIYKASEVNG